MFKDISNIVFIYLDIDDYYKLKGEFNLSVNFYFSFVTIKMYILNKYYYLVEYL